MKNFVYLLAVNLIIWVAIFGYVYSLSRRNKEIDRELKALKEQLKK
ncbi:MAG: CcmD family protein [Nitrospinae bacterium]|nr:CcmD family protein [Nitrospinota bacterium]